MVGGRGTIRLEIVPWLTEPFGERHAGRLVLEEEIERPTSLGRFLASLAGNHPGIGAVILDLERGRLFDHVSVVKNGVAIASNTVEAEIVEPGDSLVLLPAFSGG